MKHVAIKYPSEACLKQKEDFLQRPAIAGFEDVTSKLKRSFCAELLSLVKEQARYDLLFKRVDGQVHARIYGLGFEPYQ